MTRRNRAKWRKITCTACFGYGVVSDFRSGDFEGAMGCNACNEKGFNWISDKDRLADWPGGPLRGSAPGAYAEARE